MYYLTYELFNFKPWTFHPLAKNPVPFEYETVWVQGLNGLNVWRVVKSVIPIGIRASDRPAPSVAAVPTTLPAATRIENVMGSKVLGLISSGVRN